jgi:hypothetical protein
MQSLTFTLEEKSDMKKKKKKKKKKHGEYVCSTVEFIHG